ncbi:MAG: peptide chain release factor-like protein [Pirellulaceae bacterium]|nr:peptide chain release factor-like protein [Pirellulaceae bacterium]
MAPHPASLIEEELLKSCQVLRSRTKGPGGQHRNKVETGITITHDTGILGQAGERRQQEQNRKVALFRLRVNLALGLRLPRHECPSSLLSSRIQKGKIVVSSSSNEYPAILAEVLDALFELHYEVKPLAQILGTTTSQLIKFLKKEPRAILLLNEKREQKGLASYR